MGKIPGRWWVAIAAVLSLLAIVAAPSGRTPSAGFKPGDRVALHASGGKTVLVATDDRAWDDMIAAIDAHSPERLLPLVERGRVVLVEGGTKVVVVRTTFTAIRVLLDGHEVWARPENVVRYTGGSE